MSKYFIAVAGNVGVGKSTLTALLSREMGWQAFYEAVDDNPYLADFYRDMRAWSFHSQMFFLSRRLRHHCQLSRQPNTVIQDRTVYEDAEVFAHNLYQQGHFSERDYACYRELYETVRDLLPPPTLVIYLHAPVETLLERIASRGRDFERRISPEYLQQLNALYDDWIERFSLCPVLTIPSNRLDFAHKSEHMQLIVARITDKLRGKEVVTFDDLEARA